MLYYTNYSNQTIYDKDIFSEEQRKFMKLLYNEIKKSENMSQKNRVKALKEINQEKVLHWFFKLSLEDRIKMSTISNDLLNTILLNLYSLYEKDNDLTFKPTEGMLLYFSNEEINSIIIDNDFRKLAEYKNEDIQNDKILLEKYFICNHNIKSKDDKTKINQDIEKEFLEKCCNIILSDKNSLAFSEELLLDSKKFKKFFRIFSNDKFFTNILLPKNGNHIFTLPSWMFKINDSLTLSQIIIGFIEQTILLNYEYFYYINRIYESIHNNKIIEIYNEIITIVKQTDYEQYYYECIFTQDKFDEANKNTKIKKEIIRSIFEELKLYMKEYGKKEGKISELLKKLTILSLKDAKKDRIDIYKSYKKFILDFLRNEIANELINEENKNLKYKNDRKKKGKNNKDIKDNINTKKEGNKLNKKNMNRQSKAIKKQINLNNVEKNQIHENKDNYSKLINDLQPSDVNYKKKRENEINLNDDLFRINSKISTSTYKSSNYLDDLSVNENDLSITSDINLNEFQNNILNNNIIDDNDNNSINKIDDNENNLNNKVIKNKNNSNNKIDDKDNNSNNKVIDNDNNSNNKIKDNDNNPNNKVIDIDNNSNNKIKDNNNNSNNKIIHNDINSNNNNISNNNINYNNKENISYDMKNNTKNINILKDENIMNNQSKTIDNEKIIINNYNNYMNNNFINFGCYYNNMFFNPLPYNNINYSIQYYNNYQNNCFNFKSDFNNFLHSYYEKGIDEYCSIIDANLAILKPLKEKYLKIIKDIITQNLNNKYNLKFGTYGSFPTNLSIEGSDIDECIIYTKLLNDDLVFREELYDILKKNEKLLKEFTYETEKIFGTRIPRIIVKIKINDDVKKYLNNFGNLLSSDDMNIIKIDLTFNEDEEYLIKNMKSVEYIQNKLRNFPQIKPIIKILKRFLKRQKMNEVHKGGISSYSLFLLVLNCIMMFIKDNPKRNLNVGYLLIIIYRKLTYFNFKNFGINEDNLDYPLTFENSESIPYVINPLTGINVCGFGPCKGKNINSTFKIGYDKLQEEHNLFINMFNNRNNPFVFNNQIDSIVNLIK